MATPEPLAKERPAPPCWWREGYTFALAAVVAVHLVLGPVLIKVVEWADPSTNGDMVVGFPLGQLYLLGLWAALGGLSTLARLAIVGTLSVAGSAWFVTVLTLGQDEYLKHVLFGGLLAMLFVSGVAMCLLPLRGLAGWRVDFDPAYYVHLPLRRGQVGLLDYAGYTCAVAAPLVIARLILLLRSDDTVEMGSLVALLAIIGGTASIPSYLVLRSRRLWLALLASAAWIALATLLQSQASRYYTSLSLGTGGWWGIVDLRIGAFHAGVVLAALPTLGYLRRWGLKLLVVPGPAPSPGT